MSGNVFCSFFVLFFTGKERGSPVQELEENKKGDKEDSRRRRVSRQVSFQVSIFSDIFHVLIRVAT